MRAHEERQTSIDAEKMKFFGVFTRGNFGDDEKSSIQV